MTSFAAADLRVEVFRIGCIVAGEGLQAVGGQFVQHTAHAEHHGGR